MIIPVLILLSQLSLAHFVNGEQDECMPFDQFRAAVEKRMHAENFRPVKEDKLPVFNNQPPVTAWTNVWLADVGDGGLLIGGTGPDKVCSVALLPPQQWQKAVEELEGNIL
jgi:hypothetical protein